MPLAPLALPLAVLQPVPTALADQACAPPPFLTHCAELLEPLVAAAPAQWDSYR